MLNLYPWKNSFIIIVLCWGTHQAAQAQTGTSTKLRAIEDVYQQVRVKISQKKLLSNHYTFNLKRQNLNHSGYRHYAEKFYYTFSKNTPNLQLVLVRNEKENIDYQKEFLFDSLGELIYFHEKQNDEKKYPYREVKVYFEKGKMLVWNQSNQSKLLPNMVQSPKDKIDDIVKEAQQLQRKLTQQLEDF